MAARQRRSWPGDSEGWALEAQIRVRGWSESLEMETQQGGSHQWQLDLEACLRVHICSGTVATSMDLPVRGL